MNREILSAQKKEVFVLNPRDVCWNSDALETRTMIKAAIAKCFHTVRYVDTLETRASTKAVTAK